MANFDMMLNKKCALNNFIQSSNTMDLQKKSLFLHKYKRDGSYFEIISVIVEMEEIKMYVEELLCSLTQKKVVGKLPNIVKDIAIDSLSVQQSSVFICIKGYTVYGHDYAQQAVDAGAKIIVTER